MFAYSTAPEVAAKYEAGRGSPGVILVQQLLWVNFAIDPLSLDLE